MSSCLEPLDALVGECADGFDARFLTATYGHAPRLSAGDDLLHGGHHFGMTDLSKLSEGAGKVHQPQAPGTRTIAVFFLFWDSMIWARKASILMA